MKTTKTDAAVGREKGLGMYMESYVKREAPTLNVVCLSHSVPPTTTRA